MTGAAQVILVLCIFAWDAACIFGCAYLVFWQDHSGWWFVLAVFLAALSGNPYLPARRQTPKDDA